MKNSNAFAAALTGFFVWAISSLVAHYHVVAVTPNREVAAAGALTTLVLWIGRDGIRGAAFRLWNGTKRAVNGPTKPAAKS